MSDARLPALKFLQPGWYAIVMGLGGLSLAWHRAVPLMGEMGITVNFWHVADAGQDSVDLLQRLIDTYGAGPNYFVVRNLGRGSDFSQLDASPALKQALDLGARVIALPQLHEASMRKIDRQNASFWAAINTRGGPDALGMLERQRVKTWLKAAYEVIDSLPVG